MKHLLICDGGNVGNVALLCAEHGLGIEVQAFYRPEALEDAGQVEDHRARIAGIIPRAMHGPFGDLCPGSFDPMVREVARFRLGQAYAVAARLEVEHVVLHHGYVPHTSARGGWLRRSTDFWHAFFAEKSPAMQFHIENLLDLEPSLLSDVVAASDRPNVTVNLDIGHIHCNTGTAILPWITSLGRQIGYVHLHDNHGEHDEHLGLGQGTIPLVEVCHALNEYAPDAV